MADELTFPKSRGEPIGILIAVSFVLLFVVLAILNLLAGSAIILSSIWLVFVALVLCGAFYEAGGIRAWTLVVVGSLLGKWFLGFNPESPARFEYGYRALGFRVVRKTIPVPAIESVEWSAGQGSALSGKDMNDWHVVLWFDHGDPERSRRHAMMRKPDQELLIPGPSGKKESVEVLATQLTDFLRRGGASLERKEEQNTFVRPSRTM